MIRRTMRREDTSRAWGGSGHVVSSDSRRAKSLDTPTVRRYNRPRPREFVRRIAMSGKCKPVADSELGATRLAGARLRAFTLVELLVVIAIIALLISLLLPGGRRRARTGRRIRCAGNLRQIAYGWTLCDDEGRGSFPWYQKNIHWYYGGKNALRRLRSELNAGTPADQRVSGGRSLRNGVLETFHLSGGSRFLE